MSVPKALTEAAGKNYGASRMGAPLRIQQRFYERYLRLLMKHPHITITAASESGVAWWNAKIVKGPGVDW